MKNTIKIMVLGALCTCLFSCEDFLTKIPETSLSPDVYFSNEKELELWVNQDMANIMPEAHNMVSKRGDDYIGKSIDAVYSADPEIDKTAVKYDKITYLDILNKDLKVMDSTATSLCRDNHIPLRVFGIDNPENIVKAAKGENIGTIVE